MLLLLSNYNRKVYKYLFLENNMKKFYQGGEIRSNNLREYILGGLGVLSFAILLSLGVGYGCSKLNPMIKELRKIEQPYLKEKKLYKIEEPIRFRKVEESLEWCELNNNSERRT